MSFDLTKYGFEKTEKTEETKDGVSRYRILDGDYSLEVFVLKSTYCIDLRYIPINHLMPIAARYECKTKDQIEFLLFNSSRVAPFVVAAIANRTCLCPV